MNIMSQAMPTDEFTMHYFGTGFWYQNYPVWSQKIQTDLPD